MSCVGPLVRGSDPAPNPRITAALERLSRAYVHPPMVRVGAMEFQPESPFSTEAIAQLEQRGPLPRRTLDGREQIPHTTLVFYRTPDWRVREERRAVLYQSGPADDAVEVCLGSLKEGFATVNGLKAVDGVLSRLLTEDQSLRDRLFRQSAAYTYSAYLCPLAVAVEAIKRFDLASDVTLAPDTEPGLVTLTSQRGRVFVTFDEQSGVIRRFGEVLVNPREGPPAIFEYDGVLKDNVYPAPQPARGRWIDPGKPNPREADWVYITSVETFPTAPPELFRWQSIATKVYDLETSKYLRADGTSDEKATQQKLRQDAETPVVDLSLNEKGEIVDVRSTFTPQRLVLIAGGVCLLLALGVFLRRRLG